jgi:RNA polymerase sigma factor (sigma-70 family)
LQGLCATSVSEPEVVSEVPREGGQSARGVFVSAVRRHNPSECEATPQPHSPVRCLVELVRAAATKGAADTMTTHSEPGHGRPDPSLSAIISERRRLLNLAYRLLGSLTDAEDVVQETYARWYAMTQPQQEAIQSPGGWLTTVASRICLDLLGSARARRERYVGEWIPEPLPEPTDWFTGRSGGTTVDPADRVTLDESINMGFLVVLESMTPAERVAFILHDVFRYSFAEVAEIVGRTPAACRQLASSARRRIRASQVPATPAAQQADIVRAFKQAWEAKDIGALISASSTPTPRRSATAAAAWSAPSSARSKAASKSRAPASTSPPGHPTWRSWSVRSTVSPVWCFSTTASPWRCWPSTSRATGSHASGQPGTPRSSGPGRRADARLPTSGSAERRHPASPPPRGAGHHAPGRQRASPQPDPPLNTQNTISCTGALVGVGRRVRIRCCSAVMDGRPLTRPTTSLSRISRRPDLVSP